VLAEAGVRLDLSDAVLSAGFESVPEAVERGRFLQSRLGGENWDAIVAVGTRVRNILKPVDADATLSAAVAAADLARLEHPTETGLRDTLAARPETAELATLWSQWETLAPQVDQFFVDVLVNAEDPALRAARLALLRRLDASFRRLADFSKITAL
jgi:glycyl-tRNA synthetase beta chain